MMLLLGASGSCGGFQVQRGFWLFSGEIADKGEKLQTRNMIG